MSEPKKARFEQIKDYILKEAKKNYEQVPFSARTFAGWIDKAKAEFPELSKTPIGVALEDSNVNKPDVKIDFDLSAYLTETSKFISEVLEWKKKWLGDSE